MTASATLAETIDAMVGMNAAIKNMRLYPSTSDMIIKAIDRVFQSFDEILKKEQTILFAESERNLLINEQPLSESDQKKPQVVAFLNLMLNFGIKSLEFKAGLDADEIKVILDILSQKPKDIETQGGLQQLAEKENLPHIIFDQKVYVAVDKDQKVINGAGLIDEDIIKYIVGDETASEIDLNEAMEMAKDTDWVARIFQTGLSHIKESKKSSNKELSDLLIEMLTALDRISDKPGQDIISQHVAGSIATMEESVIGNLLVHSIEGVLGGSLLEHIINQLDDQKFEKLALTLKRMGGNIVDEDTPDMKPVDRAYTFLMTSKKGTQLKDKIDSKIAREKKQAQKKRTKLKEELIKVIKGDTTPFLDSHVMEQLPGAVRKLFSYNNEKGAVSIIEQTSQALFNETTDIRDNASQALGIILDDLEAMGRLDIMLNVSHDIIRWMKTDTQGTPSITQLFICLGNLASKLLQDGRFSDCNHILETLNLISTFKLKRSAEIQEIASIVSEQIADKNTIKLLLETYTKNENAVKKQVIYSLALLGGMALISLLKILKVSEDTYQRGDIIKIISKIGHLDPMILVEEIKQGGPWYYLRNLLLIMGNIGNKEHLAVLKPFLTHNDFRLQKEAVNSIIKLDTTAGSEMLLSVLPTLNDGLKLEIIPKFGKMKLISAVSPLVEMLKTKSTENQKVKPQIDEQICIALGKIGSSEAVPVLKEVTEKKKLLQRSEYADNVKEAAEKALTFLELEKKII